MCNLFRKLSFLRLPLFNKLINFFFKSLKLIPTEIERGTKWITQQVEGQRKGRTVEWWACAMEEGLVVFACESEEV